MTDTLHPARSTDFLSRLYDGELTAAEREAFAAHRSSCDECRAASDAFAATLAAFRASPTTPPAADLSARILRKIRAQSPSRRPFGVMFGIDVRWAGVFIAALLVVLISTPLVSRRRQEVAVPPSSIPARILDTPAEARAPSTQSGAAARANAAPRAPEAAPAPALTSAKDEAASVNVAEGPRREPAPGEAPADDEKRRYAPQQALAKSAPSTRSRVAAEPSGGEAAVGAASPGFLVDTLETPPRVTVQAFDGQGPAPALVSHPPDAQLAALRGHEFVLTVEAQGRVRAVQPSAGNGLLSPTKARAGEAASAVAGPADALRELRFAPGGRPRRLLVRVE
jgi:hypothetical protein